MDLFPELIGDCESILTVKRLLARLLQTQWGSRCPAILIQGETGTGKGLVARAIHAHGPRAGKRYVEINCAAIPPTLIESELFGFVQGAFTDARHDKCGLFHAAHRGTLFLDEVSLLSPDCQSKLLTTIEERTVRRVGSTQSEPVDVWLIGASSDNLLEAVQRGAFQEALYYRFAMLVVQLPPLRARKSDIMLLADHFLDRFCGEHNLPPKSFHEDARQAMLDYAWPGNVRELRNVIGRAALLYDEPAVRASMLQLPANGKPAWVANPWKAPAKPWRSSAGTTAWRPTFGWSAEDDPRSQTQSALERAGWNISQAARDLGITRNAIRFRIEKFGLRREEGRQPVEHAEGAPCPATPAPFESVAPLQDRGARFNFSRQGMPTVASLPNGWELWQIAFVAVELVRAPAGHDTAGIFTRILEEAQVRGGRLEELRPGAYLFSFGCEAITEAHLHAAATALEIARLEHPAPVNGSCDSSSAGVRVGLHVDRLLVRQVGNSRHISADAKAAVWKMLQDRMELAPAGSVAASEDTQRLFPDFFRLQIPGNGTHRALSAIHSYRVAPGNQSVR